MTLIEHAAQLYREKADATANVFDYIGPENQLEWYCKAYNELQSVKTPPASAGPEYKWIDSRHDSQFSRNNALVGVVDIMPSGAFYWTALPNRGCSLTGSTNTLPLAKAAVEAVVRAHFGESA